MESIIFWISIGIIFKALTVGSDFNLHCWFKYKKKYVNWYFEQETFKQFLENGELKNDRKETCSTNFNER